jgi:CBS-domain-containing membrane protein
MQQNVREYLEQHTIAELANFEAASARPLVILSRDNTVEQAFEQLKQHQILCAPVYDYDYNIYFGFVDVLDMIAFISAQLNWDHPDTFWNQRVDKMVDYSQCNPVLELPENTSLLITLRKMLSAKVHRVAVMNGQQQLVAVVTQSRVVRFLLQHLDVVAPQLGNMTIGQLNLGSKPVICISNEEIAQKAFARLPTDRISALGVVDKERRLVGALSAAELRGISKDNIRDLLLPVAQFLQTRKVDCELCTTNMTFRELLLKMQPRNLHRVFLVDDAGKPEAVITLTDILGQISSLAKTQLTKSQ